MYCIEIVSPASGHLQVMIWAGLESSGGSETADSVWTMAGLWTLSLMMGGRQSVPGGSMHGLAPMVVLTRRTKKKNT